jgi:hypothetical protein
MGCKILLLLLLLLLYLFFKRDFFYKGAGEADVRLVPFCSSETWSMKRLEWQHRGLKICNFYNYVLSTLVS